MKNKITYTFLSGRKNRIDNESKPYAKEFFYGFDYFKKIFKNVEIVEFEDQKSIFNFIYIVLNKLSNLPFYGNQIVNKKNYRIYNNSENLIFTNQKTAFSALPMLLPIKLIKNRKIYVFIMGVFGKKMNYKIKTFFRNLFIRLLIITCDNLFFLGKGEYEFAKKEFQKYENKFIFLPFSIDSEFWKIKNNNKKTNEVLFIGNDGMRDYKFLELLTDRMKNINFTIVSKHVDDYSFGKNVSLYKGSWDSNLLDDQFIKDLYLKSSLTLVPLKETHQPSGQSVTLQSMSCGTPVIITKTSGFWDLDKFQNNENIFFEDVNNIDIWAKRINDILNDKKLLEAVSKNSIKTIEENYSLKLFYENLEKHIFG